MYKCIKKLDCREWFISSGEYNSVLESFQKTYQPNVLFNEYVVVYRDIVNKRKMYMIFNQPHDGYPFGISKKIILFLLLVIRDRKSVV